MRSKTLFRQPCVATRTVPASANDGGIHARQQLVYGILERVHASQAEAAITRANARISPRAETGTLPSPRPGNPNRKKNPEPCSPWRRRYPYVTHNYEP